MAGEKTSGYQKQARGHSQVNSHCKWELQTLDKDQTLPKVQLIFNYTYLTLAKEKLSELWCRLVLEIFAVNGGKSLKVFKHSKKKKKETHSTWLKTVVTTDFSAKTVEAMRQWDHVLKILKGHLLISKPRVQNSILLRWRQTWNEKMLSQYVATDKKQWRKSLGGKFFSVGITKLKK